MSLVIKQKRRVPAYSYVTAMNAASRFRNVTCKVSPPSPYDKSLKQAASEINITSLVINVVKQKAQIFTRYP